LAAQVAQQGSPGGTETPIDPDDDGPGPSAPASSMPAGAIPHQPGPESHRAGDDGTASATPSPGAAQAAASTSLLTPEQDAVADEISASLAPKAEILEAMEERIEFDELENRQVRNINQKVLKVLDKAGFEVGDYIIDTAFRRSYLAVLKPRSQENKHWRKLKKHPEWVFDPKRLTELAGGCAVRRYCLAEGKDVSSFTISHFIELYYVKDLKLILTLAEEASANNYTVRQLKLVAADLREHKDEHDPGKEIIKTLEQPFPMLEDPDLMALCTDKDRVLEELSRAERKKMRPLIKERKRALYEMNTLIERFDGILSDLEDE